MRSALALLIFIFCVSAVAQQSYAPVNEEAWKEAEDIVKEGEPDFLFRLPPQGKGAALDEYKIIIARGLIITGHPIHAQYLLSEIASKSVGSAQSEEALRMIHEIAKAGVIDEMLMEEIAFDYDAKPNDVQVRSMVEYYRARVLLKKKYPEWAQRAIDDIEAGSTWEAELRFEQTLQLLASNDSTGAFEKFEYLANDAVTRQTTANLARLSMARLMFERKEFEPALTLYRTLNLPTRERARTLNEMAWSYYFNREYGKALGAIRALKSRYYEMLYSPETSVLEMLIYRELCHFEEVKDLAIDFSSEFAPVFSAIEKRQPVENLPQFVQMALQEGSLQKRAAAIQQVRRERRTLNRQKFKDESLKRSLIKTGQKRERLSDKEVGRMLKARADRLSDWFLDLREQVNFLDYESSLRSIQIEGDKASQYEPPRAQKLGSGTSFWPVNSEAWLDELFDYEILIKDRCNLKPGVSK